ncbi:hypothetical protein TYRP_022035 [Tyrophagus putrescentiae]|nr:hypothetical protein TYRP_022035 [Tyrophagus putrescentiae]
MKLFSQKSICLFGLWTLFLACLCSTFVVGRRLFSVPKKVFKKSKVTTESILNDLHHAERNVLAIGKVNDKLSVFVSDVDHSFDLVGGYRLEAYTSDGGRLQISSHPVPLPSEVPQGLVNFVCEDSSGPSLVVMDNKTVHRLALSSGSSFSLGFNSTTSSNCYSNGSLHASSNSLLHYYVITPKGNVTLGQLCFSSTTVTLTKDNCFGAFPQNLTAGYIDHRGVYLFDKGNTAYVFSRKVLDTPNPSVDLFQFDGGQIFHIVKTTPKFAPCKMKYELPPRPWWHDWIVTICGYANFAIIGLLTMAAIWLTHFNRQRRRMREMRQAAAAAAAEARGIASWAAAGARGGGGHGQADGGLRNRDRGGRRTSRSRSQSRVRSHSRSRSPRGSTSPKQRRTAATSQPVWKTKTKKGKKGKKGGKKGSKKGGGKQKRR